MWDKVPRNKTDPTGRGSSPPTAGNPIEPPPLLNVFLDLLLLERQVKWDYLEDIPSICGMESPPLFFWQIVSSPHVPWAHKCIGTHEICELSLGVMGQQANLKVSELFLLIDLVYHGEEEKAREKKGRTRMRDGRVGSTWHVFHSIPWTHF